DTVGPVEEHAGHFLRVGNLGVDGPQIGEGVRADGFLRVVFGSLEAGGQAKERIDRVGVVDVVGGHQGGIDGARQLNVENLGEEIVRLRRVGEDVAEAQILAANVIGQVL